MELTKIQKFRLGKLRGPEISGRLDQFRTYTGTFEVDYGEPYKLANGKYAITLSETQDAWLSNGSGYVEERAKFASGRLLYFAQQQLTSILGNSNPPLQQVFIPTDADIENLQKIDPKRVTAEDWVELKTARQSQIFISCGQVSAEEKALGKEIVHLVDTTTNYRGYFAEYQRSVEGVTQNIFRAINSSVGFIAVLHRRELVSQKNQNFRGSLWIEQEIALVAFLVQAMQSPIQSRVYIQKGILREGVRGFIILNPIEFDKGEEILPDLEAWLATIE